jgi:hypothetical protein
MADKYLMEAALSILEDEDGDSKPNQAMYRARWKQGYKTGRREMREEMIKAVEGRIFVGKQIVDYEMGVKALQSLLDWLLEKPCPSCKEAACVCEDLDSIRKYGYALHHNLPTHEN